jgi:hypothetical protein
MMNKLFYIILLMIFSSGRLFTQEVKWEGSSVVRDDDGTFWMAAENWFK